MFMGIFPYPQTLLQSGCTGSAVMGLCFSEWPAPHACVRGTRARAGRVWGGGCGAAAALLCPLPRLVLDPGQQLGTASSLCHGAARAGRGCREFEGWTQRALSPERSQTHRLKPLLEEVSQG